MTWSLDTGSQLPLLLELLRNVPYVKQALLYQRKFIVLPFTCKGFQNQISNVSESTNLELCMTSVIIYKDNERWS